MDRIIYVTKETVYFLFSILGIIAFLKYIFDEETVTKEKG